MFQADRVFFQCSLATGLVEWFFLAREGTFGPYPSQQVSREMLSEFVARNKAANNDGGRAAAAASSMLRLETKVRPTAVNEYDPLKRKRGKEG